MKPLLHERVEKQLQYYISNPSHALLITGPHGLGKSLVLEWVAAALLKKPNVDIRNHTAIRYIEPDEKGTISIEVIQSLRQFVKIQASGAAVEKLILIRDAECMTHEAETALLKLLEEPPSGVIILLSAASQTLLLDTILSRVTHIEIMPPTKVALAKEFGMELESIEFQKAYSVSKGVVGIMRQLLGQQKSYQSIEDAKVFINLSLFEKLARVDRLAKDRTETLSFLEALLTLYRTLSETRARKNDAKSLRVLCDKVEDVQQTIEAISQNGSAKLQLDALIFRL